MTIKLSKQESEEYFYNALCNGLGYVESGYYLSLRYNKEEYKQSADKLKKDGANVCYEDILMEILRQGHKINLYDLEGEEDHIISLKDVHEKVETIPLNYLMEMINEEDDADTADVILQTVFLGGIIFC
jgi:type IV secretory pathway VirB4 component